MCQKEHCQLSKKMNQENAFTDYKIDKWLAFRAYNDCTPINDKTQFWAKILNRYYFS